MKKEEIKCPRCGSDEVNEIYNALDGIEWKECVDCGKEW